MRHVPWGGGGDHVALRRDVNKGEKSQKFSYWYAERQEHDHDHDHQRQQPTTTTTKQQQQQQNNNNNNNNNNSNNMITMSIIAGLNDHLNVLAMRGMVECKSL